jgi:cold shock CspA family protein
MVSLVGTVTKWFAKRHFGKVSSDDGVFDMHISAWKDLMEPAVGMAVEFSVVHDFTKSKLVCADVRCLDSIMAPVPGPVASNPVMTPRNHHARNTPRNLQVERRLSEGTVTGTVKVWSRRGYGFITSSAEVHWPRYQPTGCDIYVARADLLELSNLAVGMQVEFRVYKCDGGKTQIGAAQVKELKCDLGMANLRVVPFWEWPLTQDAKKMRVMSLYHQEASDLQDDLEKCEDEASEQLEQMQRELKLKDKQLKKAHARIAELEKFLKR